MCCCGGILKTRGCCGFMESCQACVCDLSPSCGTDTFFLLLKTKGGFYFSALLYIVFLFVIFCSNPISSFLRTVSHLCLIRSRTLSLLEVEKNPTNEIPARVVRLFILTNIFVLAICRTLLADINLFIPTLSSFSFSSISLYLPSSSSCLPDNQYFNIKKFFHVLSSVCCF